MSIPTLVVAVAVLLVPHARGDLVIARRAFEPRCDHVHVTYWTGPLKRRAYAWTVRGECRVTVSVLWKHADPVRRCTVMVHEYGHLAGHHHSHNPRSVMYPWRTSRNEWPACERRYAGR